MIIGVIAGLWAALFQSLSYLGTRHFLHGRTGGTRMLLVLSHLWMGAVCILILPFFWPEQGIRWSDIYIPLLGDAVCYLIGQFGLLLALRRAEPSQVAPMLALKLLIVGLLTVFVKELPILAPQWAAIAACIGGTFVLNYTPRDRMPLKVVITLLFTCFFYALSDWSIGYLVPAFGDIPQWQAIMCASLLAYIVCGLAAIPFIPWYGSRKWSDWRDSLPYSTSWLLATFGLYASFAMVGVVYGGILQSTRSIMGVFLAALLTRIGKTHLEDMRTRGVFFRRLTAAVLMTLAVILWAIPLFHSGGT